MAEIADTLDAAPHGYGQRCDDRRAWTDSRVVRLLESEVLRASALLHSSFPDWDDDAYLDYSRTGRRTRGESMMQARRSWLAPLVFAECVEYRGRYLAAIDRVIRELVRQPTWTLPAHDPRLLNFRGLRFSVDLAAAQQANEIAQALYMLGDAVPRPTREKALAAIRRRVLDPVRKSIVRGHGQDWYEDNGWLVTQNNWNAVCLKGVVGSALAVLPSRRDRAFFVAAAVVFSKHYIDGFPADGYAPEGVNYWNYGFSRFAMLRSMLMDATGGRLDLFRGEKVRLIARFGRRFQMRPDSVAAFGDSPFDAVPSAALNTYLDEALSGAKAADSSPIWFDGELSNEPIFLFRQRGTSLPEKRRARSADHGEALRTYFRVSGVYVGRIPAPTRCKLGLTIKANGNTSHSHNDVGSYTIALNSYRPVGDPGGPLYYDRALSGRHRYDRALLNSVGHPVPLVDGHTQVDARTVAHGLMTAAFSDDADKITIDLSPAYRLPSRSLVRTVIFDRARCLVALRDDFAFDHPLNFETAVTTLSQWTMRKSGSLTIGRRGQKLLADIVASPGVHISARQFAQYGVHFTRIALAMHHPKSSGFVEVRFAPATSIGGPSH
jgi:hypothetical protein